MISSDPISESIVAEDDIAENPDDNNVEDSHPVEEIEVKNNLDDMARIFFYNLK